MGDQLGESALNRLTSEENFGFLGLSLRNSLHLAVKIAIIDQFYRNYYGRGSTCAFKSIGITGI